MKYSFTLSSCSFLFLLVDGYGDWSSEDCERAEPYSEFNESVKCHCSHLTSFSILLVKEKLLDNLWYIYFHLIKLLLRPINS